MYHDRPWQVELNIMYSCFLVCSAIGNVVIDTWWPSDFLSWKKAAKPTVYDPKNENNRGKKMIDVYLRKEHLYNRGLEIVDRGYRQHN